MILVEDQQSTERMLPAEQALNRELPPAFQPAIITSNFESEGLDKRECVI
jgi:hypothetical protein